MESYDDDFSTLKAAPRQFARASRPLSTWKPDIPLGDGDATARRIPKTSPGVVSGLDDELDFEDDDEVDDDFANDLETAVRHRRTQSQLSDNLPEAFMSDSSSRSPGRASVSSAASASSIPTSWDQDEDFDLDVGPRHVDFKEDLANRFKIRQQRAQAEALAEAQQARANTRRKKSVEFEDEMLDIDIEQLTLRLKTGSANKNVKLHAPTVQAAQPSKMLRGMRSIAQLPQHRTDSSQRLRGAVSMLDLGSRPPPSLSSPGPAAGGRRGLSGLGSSQTLKTRQRPLTAYKEQDKRPHGPELRKHKSRHVINLIQNPAPTLTKQERKGMTLNPDTGMWEGNEDDTLRFDLDGGVKPTLITKQKLGTPPEIHAGQNGMLFDNRTLSWVYANEDEYDDPFEGIDDQMTQPLFSPRSQIDLRSKFTPMSSARRVPTIDSQASTNSMASSFNNLSRSVARSESSGMEVFEVSPRMLMEWKHSDERFMRKFGKWIGGEEEKADARLRDQHFYEMVRNT